MNSIAQELAGFYAIPKRQGRLVQNMDPMPVPRMEKYATFAEECKKLHARGWSRGKIAEKMGISLSVVYKYVK
jgi:hypothetical protein